MTGGYRGSADARQARPPRRAGNRPRNAPGRLYSTQADRGAAGGATDRERATSTVTTAASSSGVGVPRTTRSIGSVSLTTAA